MEKSIEEVNHLNSVRLSAVCKRQPGAWRLAAEQALQAKREGRVICEPCSTKIKNKKENTFWAI